ncbi:hypothetical protein F130042H8_19510 [Enterocloster alcoholdehydrogenati]|uniref:Uncharacterized protein n=1 Tax=Enterocloster alcoholdehydrogenati TaxID=2547410 RepID=A0ABQ0AY27_9FIRM
MYSCHIRDLPPLSLGGTQGGAASAPDCTAYVKQKTEDTAFCLEDIGRGLYCFYKNTKTKHKIDTNQ